MSIGKNAPQWHLPGYSGHVPRYAESFGVTYARATSAVLEPVRNPSPCVYQWQEGSGTAATTRSVTQSPGFLPGPGYNGVLHTVAGQPQVTVTQGSKTNLKAYYDSLAREEAATHAKAAALGVPVQEKKKTRNNSNVSMGDQFYWTGKHMFQTSFQEAFPDIAKANKQAAGPGPRVNYTAVEKDAAKAHALVHPHALTCTCTCLHTHMQACVSMFGRYQQMYVHMRTSVHTRTCLRAHRRSPT